MKEIQIYCREASGRHTYVFDVIFKDLLGISYQWTAEPAQAHLSYDEEGTLSCKPCGLLSETGIDQKWKDRAQFESWDQTWCCYPTGSGELPFDLFAATFFLLSRYEEHLDFFPDEHDRFTARESVLAQHELLNEPLVNQWALKLKEILLAHHPHLVFQPRKFEYRSTIDIDQAWKFRNKGLKRNIAGFFRDLIQGKWENARDRWPVLFGLRPDPFFNYTWQNEAHQKHGIPVDYFILLGDLGPWDKNIAWNHPHFVQLLRELDAKPNYTLGIHPSYYSNEAEQQVKKEISRLEEHLEREITTSRQHFLMHRFPGTYDQLIAMGIREEHSMGYSTHTGFRAGIAAPFPYFDLNANKSTDLILVPFCLMDITPLHYLEMSVSESVQMMEGLMEKVKKVGGCFVSLWHNESLSETERWKGWRPLYTAMLESATS